MSGEVIFEGGCLCGAVRYRATAAPVRGVICHCSMCRKHSGAPALAFIHFLVESFNWVKGEPTRYRSSAYAERGFCSRCGSTLTMHEQILSDRVLVAVVSMNRNAYTLTITYGHRTKCRGSRSRTSCRGFGKTAPPCQQELSMVTRPNLGIQGTPISVVPLCRRGAGAPDAGRSAS